MQSSYHCKKYFNQYNILDQYHILKNRAPGPQSWDDDTSTPLGSLYSSSKMGNSVCEEEVGTTMLYEHENDRYVSKQANFTLINKVINR